MGHIFISHRNSPADNDWAKKIHRWIKDQKGIRGFLDFDIQDGLQVGQKWEDEIYAAMNRAQVVIAIVSKDWLKSDWCLSEARMARLLGRKLILIITQECEVPFRDTQSIRIEKHGEAQAFELLRHALRTTHERPDRPYPGLGAFEEKDAAVFFGREDETRALENQIDSLFQGRPETARLLLLLGASGSGKSSLMRAGLIPGFKSDTTHFCVEPIIPRGDPLGELAFALDLDLDDQVTDVAAKAILARIKELAPSYRRVLLPIDQAEELLRGDHNRFFDVVRAVLEGGRGRIIVLATMRSDFLNAFQQSGLIGSGTALSYDTFTLDPLPKDRLPDIIQKPAGLYGVTFEEGLIARIMQDQGGPDALPLLAFFLNEFWRKDYFSDGVLHLREYESFGGLSKALRKAVGDTLDACARCDPTFSDRDTLLETLENLFLGHLVSVSSASGEAVRNRASASDLTDGQRALLTEFARKRLLINRDGTWEVVHEALFRQWADLRDWIEAARDDLVIIDRVQAASKQWDETGRQDADLSHEGNRLSEAFGLMRGTRYGARFGKTDTDYLSACDQKYRDQLAKEAALREKAEQEGARARQGESRARRFTKIAAAVALLAIGTSAVAYWQWDRAAEQTAIANDQTAQAERQTVLAQQSTEQAEAAARRALKNQRLGLAALSASELQAGRAPEAAVLALAAWPRGPEPDADLRDLEVAVDALSAAVVAQREILRLEGHDGPVNSVAFSPDGTRLVTAGGNGTKLIWDATTGTEILRLEDTGWVYSVAFSPDGTRLATAGEDGTARIWDGTTGVEILRLDDHEGWVTSVAFSPDGTRLATASGDGTARIWDGTTLVEILRLEGHDGGVISVVFSPDGTRLATAGSDGTARIWDGTTGAEILWLEGQEGWGTSVAFAPDGTRVATAGADGTARIWDGTTGAEIARLEDHEDAVTSVVFSPDGKWLVTASWDGTAQVWDGTTGAEIVRLEGHEGGVYSVAFSRDGTRLATGSEDGTTRIWDLAGLAETLRLDDHDGGVNSVAFSPDGTRLATAGSDGTARIWDWTTGTEIMRLEEFEVSFTSVVFSPDGMRLATASWGGMMRIWDATTWAEILRWEGHDSSVYSVAFSPDGTRLATASYDRTARLWDSTTGAETLRLDDRSVTSVAFSPDGTQLATAGFDGTARIWDATTGAEILRLEGHEGEFNSVSFSADGTRLATAGDDDGTVRIWDGSTGAEIAQLQGHESTVLSVAFAPDGTRLATGGGDRTARIWDGATGAEIMRLEGGETRVTSVAFSPDGTRLVTAAEDGTARIWNIDIGKGNVFQIACLRRPTLSLPKILETYGIDIGEPICSGEEPLPPRLTEEDTE